MPIKPENRARYPKDWKHIRARIQLRAGNKCEKCGVPNHETIYRDEHGWHLVGMPGEKYLEPRLSSNWAIAHDVKVVRIVCTTAHLDHVPENCDESNLRFWCQRCHLGYDAAHHAKNARETRRKGKALEMFACG